MSEEVADLLDGLSRALVASTRSEPRELTSIRNGLARTDAGTYGQWFSAFHDIHHDLRWFVERVFPMLLTASTSGRFSLDELRKLTRLMIGRRMDFVSWLGLETFARYTDRLQELLPRIETVEDFRRCVLALHLYADRLFAWTTHYYPWGAVGLFPPRSEDDLRATLELARSETRVRRQIKGEGRHAQESG